MKKTCLNCRHFHGCLSEANSSYHMHNYCDRLNVSLSSNLTAEVGRFLRDYWHVISEMPSDSPSSALYDDFETGDACCWLFEPTDESDGGVLQDATMDANKDSNVELAIRVLEHMLTAVDTTEAADGEPQSLRYCHDEDELKYFIKLLAKLKKERR